MPLMAFIGSLNKIVKDMTLINKSTLKKRGWSEATIKKLYPAPEKEYLNPNNFNKPVKQYSLEKVIGLELANETYFNK